MKKIISYLLAVLMTAWTGALTIAVSIYLLGWITAALEMAGKSNTLLVVALITMLIVATTAASALVKERMQKWDNKDK